MAATLNPRKYWVIIDNPGDSYFTGGSAVPYQEFEEERNKILDRGGKPPTIRIRFEEPPGNGNGKLLPTLKPFDPYKFADYVLRNNVFSDADTFIYSGLSGTNPHGVPDHIWAESLASMGGEFVKTGDLYVVKTPGVERPPDMRARPTWREITPLMSTEPIPRKHFWVEKNVPYETWAIVEAFPGGTVRSPFNTKEEAIKREEEIAEGIWELKQVPSPQEKFPAQHETLKKLYPYEFVEYDDDGDLTIQLLIPKPKPQVGFKKGDTIVVTTDGRTFKELSPSTIDLLAATEGDPIRKFCCRQCAECAPAELLEEGKFPERIAWLRHHYKEKHPGMWGKKQPAVIPTQPSPRLPSPKQELEFVADSPEYLAFTIDDIGYREKLDTAFETAIARAKGG